MAEVLDIEVEAWMELDVEVFFKRAPKRGQLVRFVGAPMAGVFRVRSVRTSRFPGFFIVRLRPVDIEV